MNFKNYLEKLNENLALGSERSHYSALTELIKDPLIGINTVIEERGNKVGIPDFTIKKSVSNNNILVGYIEAKKIGENLNKIQETEQLQRYRDSSIGENLILTDFLEFRLFRDGKLHLYGSLGKLENDQIVLYKNFNKVSNLINEFVNYQQKSINNYLDLAQQMAVNTKSVKYAVEEALNDEQIEIIFIYLILNICHENLFNKFLFLIIEKYRLYDYKLTQLQLSFSESLIPNLDNQEFADMYAQTLAYGLFIARIEHETIKLNSSLNKGGRGGSNFNKQNANTFITNKIPFLKGLFSKVIKTDFDTEIDWAIDNLIEIFAKVDINNILENFNQETKREDPVFHFYESFLANYSADLRKSRGVYYTPEPIVSFIVKAVNDILDNDFNMQDGLGNRDVTVLDPATGTGTFLYQVIKQIYLNFNRYRLNAWNELFKDKKFLDRIYGFELLMTPYIIANLKLQLLLGNLGYKFDKDERLNIFLTNTLEEGIKKSEFFLSEYISKEASSAAEIKKKTLIHVVLGNPPYAGHSANKNEFIEGLVNDYYMVDGVPLNEKNTKWLQDDYVKFIRFGQHQIDKTGMGILAFVTNHGYLDNPTFRGMRQNLTQSFSRIFVINLHGNIKKKEVAPNGDKDENVFDIQQGVSILIAVKDMPEEHWKFLLKYINPNFKIPEKGIYYYDLWGSREDKYKALHELTLNSIEWEEVKPVKPFYLFTPQNEILQEEYNQLWKITDIMPVNSVGIVTARDGLTIQNSPKDVEKVVKDFVSLSEEEAREKYNLRQDSQDWKVSLAQKDIQDSFIKNKINKDLIIPILYRPFDLKYTYYTGKSGGFICRPRSEIMRNMLLGDNLGIAIGRAGQVIDSGEWNIIFCTNYITEFNLYRRGGNNVFPLYIYPDTENGQNHLKERREANFSPEFITEITNLLGYQPTPENIFYYIYAILHSEDYRYRYAPFLKIDFPRIPLTSNDESFKQLATKGEELVNLHLLRQLPDIKITQNQTISTKDLPLFNEESQGDIHYQGDGNNEIQKVAYNSENQKLLIGKGCYFKGIREEVWQFKIGGYQVLNKWLKDRKKANINLTREDITHYQKIIVVLQETIKIMKEIDQIIPDFPF